VTTCLSSDDKWLVTGSFDKTARLWDLATGKEIRSFRGHDHSIDSASLSNDGKRLVTGSADCTTRLWDVATGQELCRLISFDDGTWAVFDADGRFDAANAGDIPWLYGVVGNQTIPLKQLKDRYYDPGLFAKYMGQNKQPLRKLAGLRKSNDPQISRINASLGI
jgi:WD domain, G-beta repeat